MLDFTEQETIGWQWHQRHRVKIIFSLHSRQINTPASHSVLYGLDALPELSGRFQEAAKHWSDMARASLEVKALEPRF